MTVTIDELLAGIRKTREGMSLSMLRDGEAIYRRLLPRHQDRYDDLNIDVVWLTADMPRLRGRIERANRNVKSEDPA
jgi:hypothetical protein